MTCRERKEQAPLYLSQEMNGAERERFAAHVAACPACRREMEAEALIDARMAAALGGELPDATRVEQRVRSEISRGEARRRWLTAGAIAAGVLAAAGLFALLRQAPPPAWYADAANDHRVEVVEGRPRRWRSEAAEVGGVAAQSGLTYGQAAGLAAPGYSLERAKICGLRGERMLHLVFSDGTRKYSVFVGPRNGETEAARHVQRGPEQLSGFDKGGLRAVVVSLGPAAECDEFARVAAAKL